MIEFKKKIFIFKIEGKEYEVKKPNVKQVSEFQKKAAKAEDKDSVELTVEFLSELGLPSEVSFEMEVEHLQTIVEYVTGQKKS